MAIAKSIRTFMGSATRSAQLQAEIREGVANLAELTSNKASDLQSTSDRIAQLQQEIRDGIENLAILLDQRMREQIAQHENSSRRLEQRLRELTNALLRADPGSADRSVSSLSVADRRDPIGTAPVARLPMPQISLRRPNAIADLLATREFQDYRSFFDASPTHARSDLPAAGHAIVYAFTRKVRPSRAVVLSSDGGAVAETVARAVLETGSGRVLVFDPKPDASDQISSWPAELNAVTSFEGSRLAMPEGPAELVFVGGEPSEHEAAELVETAAGKVHARGVLLVGSLHNPNVEKALRRFSEAHPDWTVWRSAERPSPRVAVCISRPAADQNYLSIAI
jgi:hypothetical protein